ncbi:MAG TPA: coenzyme F420 hydrogenase subunit beta, partial [Methanocorpusculum sp.]|nr:coenzyme F420 hydrogenase subunit beta [Methanocorpusculum sp.]HJJ33094.1 coenzyme F420 hydrogenase subunit beta [Methanocorpusculum sp.]
TVFVRSAVGEKVWNDAVKSGWIVAEDADLKGQFGIPMVDKLAHTKIDGNAKYLEARKNGLKPGLKPLRNPYI